MARGAGHTAAAAGRSSIRRRRGRPHAPARAPLRPRPDRRARTRRGAAVRRHRPGAARRARRALAVQRRRDRPAGGRRPLRARRGDARASGAPTASSSPTPSRRCGRSSRTTPARTAAAAPATGCSRASASRTTGPAGSARTSAPIPARRRTACGSPARRGRTSRRSSRSTTATAGRRSSRTSAARRSARSPTRTGRRTGSGASADPDAIAAVQEALRPAELLIADGHHRYETARVYADEIGGDGPHRYVLMCLVSLGDPGLTIFPTHRLLTGLDDEQRVALREAIRRDWDVEEIEASTTSSRAPADDGRVRIGYLDAHHGRPLRLTLKDPAIADAALPGQAGRLPPARHGGDRGAAAAGRARHERGRHLAPARARLRALDGRGARARALRRRAGRAVHGARRRSSWCARSRRPARSCRRSRRTSSLKSSTGLLFNPLED